MLYAILIMAVIILGFGWLNQWVCSASLIMYMQGKEYTLPTERESKACLTEVWLRVLKIKK